MELWYYARNGVQTGPLRFEELEAVVARGQLAPNDFVWKEGTTDWIPASSVEGLFPTITPAPIPHPPPVLARAPVPPPVRHAAEPEPSAGPTGPSVWTELVARAKQFLTRATATNPTTIVPDASEDDRLTRAGILDPTARRIAVWRRSVLWVAAVPTAFCAFFGLISTLAGDTENLSIFGVLVVYLHSLVLFALPAAAILAARAFDQPRESARWVLLGAVVSAGVPLVTAFIPATALFDIEGGADSAARVAFGMTMGVVFYLILMPTVLSLLPAASRACIRLKSFLPQSLVPGWGLVASVPLFALLTLASVVLLYHVVGNFLLIAGLAMWAGAPLLYLNRFSLLTRPLTEPRDLESLATTNRTVLVTATGGVVLLVIYLFTAKFMGQSVLGFSDSDSLLQPWSLSLHTKWMEFVGRSLFMTVLFTDLLVRMTLSVWREDRAFAESPAAAGFDKTMNGLGEATEGKREARTPNHGVEVP